MVFGRCQNHQNKSHISPKNHDLNIIFMQKKKTKKQTNKKHHIIVVLVLNLCLCARSSSFFLHVFGKTFKETPYTLVHRPATPPPFITNFCLRRPLLLLHCCPQHQHQHLTNCAPFIVQCSLTPKSPDLATTGFQHSIANALHHPPSPPTPKTTPSIRKPLASSQFTPYSYNHPIHRPPSHDQSCRMEFNSPRDEIPCGNNIIFNKNIDDEHDH